MNPWLKKALRCNHPTKKTVDVAIVGSPLSALYMSYKLADAGFTVAVFEEREQLAFGFSRRSLGQARLGLGDNPYRLALALGEETVHNILRFSAQSIDSIADIGCLDRCGGLEIATDKREEQEIQESNALCNKIGFKSQYWDQQKIGRQSNSTNLLSGRWVPQEGLVCLQTLSSNILKRAIQSNVFVHCPIRIHDIQTANSKVLIDHERGETQAEIVVYTAGENLPRMDGYFSDKRTTVRAQALGYKRGHSGSVFSHHAQYGYVYWRDYGPYRFLGGCRWATPHLEQGETDDQITVPKIEEHLKKFAQKNFGATNVDIAYRWSGIEERSCDGLPIIGPMPGRIDTLICSALQGRELGLGFSAANSIVQLLLEGVAPSLPAIFSPQRFL